MHVHTTHRLEQLVDGLAHTLAGAAPDPITPEHLVVPSRALGRWVQLELARRDGIAAHLALWRPRGLVEHLLPSSDGADAWLPERLAWRLTARLPELLEHETFASLRGWVHPDGAGDAEATVRRWQLARRLGHLVDAYTVHRPAWVEAWSAGSDDGVAAEDRWQPHLWRRLEAELGPHHLAARARRFLAEPLPDGLPARVCLFGVGALPPLFLRVLHHLAARSEVHLFVLSPGRSVAASDEDRHPLRASLGRVGRDLERLLGELDVPTAELPAPAPPADSLLHALQADVLADRPRAAHERLPLPPGDRSLQVLGCHSPAREVEVLRDTLWSLLQADSTLRPRDVLVLVPDLATHGPLIDAVFGVAPDDPLHLPHALADRTGSTGHEIARALLDVLALAGSRLTAPQVIDLLSHGPVRRRFGIGEAELSDVEQLVAGAGIRWGRHAAHRASVGQPEVERHTWRFGLDRLLLGHVVLGADPVAGVMPCQGVEGEVAHRVGRLAELLADLLARLDDLTTPRPLNAHLAGLLELVADWFGADPDATDQVQRVRASLLELADEATGFEGEVPLAVVRELVEHRLLRAGGGGGFLRSGVTFAALRPGRVVPARVVVLVGLGDGAFPRVDLPLGFDLVARQPRPGDPSRRHTDRALVLDALLSARDALVVTYVSHSVQDNAPRPPGVVLADLLDAVDATVLPPEGCAAARERVVVHHPLQPFSPRYVTVPAGGPALRSWDPATCRGAAALVQGAVPARPFLSGAAPPLEPVDAVDLDQLERFLVDPVRAFLQQRLGVGRVADLEPLPDREPLELGPLEEHAVGERMLALRQQGLGWGAVAEVLGGEGRLPVGHLANPLLARVAGRVDDLLRVAARRLDDDPLPPVRVDVELGGVRLTGRIDGLRRGARVDLAYGTVGPDDGRPRLRSWVRHLALQLAEGDPPRVSERFGHDGTHARRVLTLPPLPPDDARERLAALVQLHVHGQVAPLPFLADAGWVLVREIAAGTWGKRALFRARLAAEAHWALHPDSAHAWELLAGGADALQPPTDRFAEPLPFERLAQGILGPLLHLLEARR